MKCAILHPACPWDVESFASMFREGIVLHGSPLVDDDANARWQSELKRIGLRIFFSQRDFEHLSLSDFDLVIENARSLAEQEGAVSDGRPEWPSILLADGIDPLELPDAYRSDAGKVPVLTPCEVQRQRFLSAGFTDVHVFPLPVPFWWFQRPWLGDWTQVVLAPATRYEADETTEKAPLIERFRERFGDAIHPASRRWRELTSRERADVLARARAYVDVGAPGDGRLAAEAFSAGVPVATIDSPLPGWRPPACNAFEGSFDAVCRQVERCLADHRFARELGRRSRSFAKVSLDDHKARKRLDGLVPRALAAHRGRPKVIDVAKPTERFPSPAESVFAQIADRCGQELPNDFEPVSAVHAFYSDPTRWNEFGDWIERPVAYVHFDRQFVERAVRMEGRRVVNIGCYFPWAERTWGDQVAAWHAIDINPFVLQRARATVDERNHGNIHFHELDITRPLPVEWIDRLVADVVLDLSTFDQLDPRTWETVFENYRLLAPRLVLAYDGTSDGEPRFQVDRHGFTAQLNRELVEAMLRSAGYAIVAHEPQYYHDRGYIHAVTPNGQVTDDDSIGAWGLRQPTLTRRSCASFARDARTPVN